MHLMYQILWYRNIEERVRSVNVLSKITNISFPIIYNLTSEVEVINARYDNPRQGGKLAEITFLYDICFTD